MAAEIGACHTLFFGGSLKKPYLCIVKRRKAALCILLSGRDELYVT